MQKQFKQLDDQLELNHLIRQSDPIPKPANSFFRALSISLFSTHHQAEFVKSIMKLTLLANCQAYENTLLKKKRKHHIAFPIISQSSDLVKKFVNDKEMLQTYAQSPDLQCFQNDNYELAAFTFNRRVSVYYLNKEGYLNEMLISCCRNKTGRKIHLCKVGKRYFAVEKESIKSMTLYIREYLLGQMINQIVLDKSDKENAKVHFSALDEMGISPHKKYPKIHKKSLSQCGDITNKLEEFRSNYGQIQMDSEFHTNIKGKYNLVLQESFEEIENRSHQDDRKKLNERDLDYFQDKEQESSGSVAVDSPEVKETEKRDGDLVQVESKNETGAETSGQIEQILSQTAPITVAQQHQQPISQQPQYSYVIQPHQQQQYTPQQYASQMQAYYQSQQQYIYSGYPADYSQSYYANYYNMQQQMMYDPQYYAYYQQQMQQQQQVQEAYPYTQPQEAYTYSQQQETYTYTQPQQLVTNNRYTGRLKFYDTSGKYGFIIVDGIGSDLFVHYDDLSKAGMTKEHLETHSASRELRFQFTYYEYEGKNKKAKKAIDLKPLTQ